jgi:hypothetical protein
MIYEWETIAAMGQIDTSTIYMQYTAHHASQRNTTAIISSKYNGIRGAI